VTTRRSHKFIIAIVLSAFLLLGALTWHTPSKSQGTQYPAPVHGLQAPPFQTTSFGRLLPDLSKLFKKIPGPKLSFPSPSVAPVPSTPSTTLPPAPSPAPSAADSPSPTPISTPVPPPPVVTPPASPTPTPIPSESGGSDATSTNTANWECIRTHESTDRYNDPSAPSGAYGIIQQTAAAEGLPWPVSDASPAQQDAAALDLYAKYGWSPWETRTVCNL
jgi:hypothetical protein